jgi:tetratricopeptide (TPR) repeat protein
LEGLRGYGGRDGILTIDELLAVYMDKVEPQPRWNEFGDNQPGSSFLFIAGENIPPSTETMRRKQEFARRGEVSEKREEDFRVRKIQDLLNEADAYYKRQWYMTPEETNAFDLYRKVLQLDPKNEHANLQIDRMAEFYKSRADRAIQRGGTHQAILYYRRYLKIVPNDEAILDKIAQLDDQSSAMVWGRTTWDNSFWQ